MYISRVSIKNFRLFDESKEYEIDNFNIPDGVNQGSGLTALVGENGCGKTTVLDAISIPILEYKADTFSINDMNNPEKDTDIKVFSKETFKVKGTYPNTEYDFKGFNFIAKLRAKENKAYLSSILVSDQLFIKEDPNKPKDGAPDLRVNVTNPFSGKRFNETDILYLDRNRLFQTRSGTYNTTRFDRLMNDFNYQYKKNSEEIIDLNTFLNTTIKKDKIENKFLEKAIEKFKEISEQKVQLDFIDNYSPFKNASFVIKKDNNQQIYLNEIGSGYEMIFSIIYSYYMAEQNGKNMIILIDEPELHLHPKLQQEFINFLLEVSQKIQVIITTHAPLLVKQLSYNSYVTTKVLKKDKSNSIIVDRKLSYISANETNYIAFELATEEYHNELYEELYFKYIENSNNPQCRIKEFDNKFFIIEKGENKIYPWMGNMNEVSIHTFVRNQIHHRSENGIAKLENLQQSIEIMRTYL